MSLGTGVTMIEVAKELGYYANPLCQDLVCKHQNINKWSAWKPVRSNRETITDMSIIDISYGFDKDYIYSIDSGEVCLTRSKAKQGDWDYIQPNAKYRLGDFRHYNKSAIPPYSKGYCPTLINGSYRNVSADIIVNSEADIKLQNMEMIDTGHTWHYGVIWKKQGGEYGLALSDWNLGQTNPQGRIDIDFTIPSVGNYDFCWCITDATAITQASTGFVYLPNGYWSGVCSIVQTGVIFAPRKAHPEDYPISIEYNGGGQIEKVHIQWEAINNDSYTYDVQIRCQEFLEGEQPGTTHSSSTISMVSKDVATGTLSFYPGYGGAQDDTIFFVLSVNYNYTTRYYVFDEEWGTGHISDTMPEPVSPAYLRQKGWIAPLSE